MIAVLVLMAVGTGLGLYLGKYPKLIKLNDRLTSLAIYLLLFLLGISVGLNDKIMNNLDTIGVKALVITIGALAGSMVCALLVYKLFFKEGGSHEG
ncbi:DUF340 domain-containing protein [Puteibacter caeruleilacunae]|nr:DUF340 domain-containing protein [Puteibacter caeruleilacunae]